jgi:Raf kinase inhibitor-like YbhB/YbcL family protein
MSPNPIGVLLRNRRAGHHQLVWADPALTPSTDAGAMRLTSPAFDHGAPIPEAHKGRLRGANVSPALAWTRPPVGTAELVLVVQDPDVPFGKPAVHALARITDSAVTELPDDALSPRVTVPGLLLGAGVMGRREYAGPMPVRSHGPHAYVFQLFAVDRELDVPERFGLADVVSAMAGHVIARARLDGMYEIV